jgi:hypothetical protein
MLSDDDMVGVMADFGVLAAKVACTIKRGSKTGASQRTGEPYTALANHYCTVLSLSQVKDAYLNSFSKEMVQSTKNPRVILLPLPIPNGVEMQRYDYIVVGSDRFSVLDLDNNSSYQFARVCFCQYVEGSTI